MEGEFKEISKRGAQGAGTIRKYKNMWQGRITIGRDPGTGKQIQKSIYGKTQAEVRQKMTAALADLDNGLYIEPSKMTVGQWLDTWIDDYHTSIDTTTKTVYRSKIETHLKPTIGAIKLTELNTHHVQKMYNKLSDSIAPSTVKGVHNVLNSAMKKALQLNYIKVNPCTAAQLPKAQKKDIKPLTEKQIPEFLNVIKGSDYENLFKVDLFTGMRQGEIMGLTWDRIDFDHGTITIDRQLVFEKDSKTYHLKPTKTDNIRKIKPAAAVMNILKKVKVEQAKDRLKAGPLWQENPDLPNLVFTNKTGCHLYHNTLWDNAKKYAAKIGVNDFRFHDLRHTYAVMAIRAGDDIKTISSNLGHSNISITLDIYAHYTVDMMNDSSNRMQAYMERTGTI